MRRRTLPFAAALVVTASVMAGCSDPAPAPSPSGTGFATEAEAFAAAEATYRAYVEALNRVDLSDPNTFEDVYRWTTGEANAAARESFSQMHAEGWTVSGVSTIDALVPVGYSRDEGATSLAVCLNVSAVTVVDVRGESQVDANRGDVQSMLVHVVSSKEKSFVDRISGREGEPVC